MARDALSYIALPRLAISLNAVTPNPGKTGSLAWSTTLSDVVRWDGSAWKLSSIGISLDKSTTPTSVSSATGSPGNANTGAPSNHSHGHGNVAGSGAADVYHAAATASVYGMMSPTQFNKLAGIQDGATNTAAPPAAPGSAPPNITTATSSLGNSGTYANSNHSHGHGDVAGSATVNQYHAAASTSVYGMMSPTDFNKCQNLAANAGAAYAPNQMASSGANGMLSIADFNKLQNLASNANATYASTQLASASVNGLLSTTDFNKLQNLASNANAAYQPAGAYASTALATVSANGLMAAADYKRLWVNPGPIPFPGQYESARWWIPIGGSNIAHEIGMQWQLVSGSGYSASSVGANPWTYIPRIAYTAGAAVGSFGGLVTQLPQCFRSSAGWQLGGFFFATRFCYYTANYAGTCFVGLVGDYGGNGYNSSLLAYKNLVGLYRPNTANAALQIATTNETGTLSVHNTAWISSSAYYAGIDFYIYQPRGTTNYTFGWRQTGTTSENTWTTYNVTSGNLPLSGWGGGEQRLIIQVSSSGSGYTAGVEVGQTFLIA